jgi:Na+-transporting NADH:ubiquinone oxidoreductase subunit C
MNVQGNTYTFLYATIIVLVVATGLAIVATALQPAQVKNVELEKKQNILTSLHVQSDRSNAGQLYEKYITDSYTLNSKGEKVEGIDPFDINLRAEMRKSPAKRNLPAFEAKKGDTSFVVIPVYGKGLWGPIWGYVSFRKESQVKEGQPHFNTIYGVMFDHKSETPGLGAEINQPFFMNPFSGKKIFDPKGDFVSVDVVKGKGLEAMLDSCLVSYQTFFKQNN